MEEEITSMYMISKEWKQVVYYSLGTY